MANHIDDLDKAKKYWDNYITNNVQTWDRDISPFFHPDIEIKKDWVILDLGCGPGRLARLVCGLIKQYYGCDSSGEMIKEAKKRCVNIKNSTFIQNDGQTLKEFKDNFFDAVHVFSVFQHMSNDVIASYLREISRVLKPNGFLIANFPRPSIYRYGLDEKELKEIFDFVNLDWKELECEEKLGAIYWVDTKLQFYVMGTKKGDKNEVYS